MALTEEEKDVLRDKILHLIRALAPQLDLQDLLDVASKMTGPRKSNRVSAQLNN